MTIESIPEFTDPAAKLWANIPSHSKKLLLSKLSGAENAIMRSRLPISQGQSKQATCG